MNQTKKFKPGDVFADASVDFAFKRIFGTERYKAATIGLLNSFITDRHIVDVKYQNTEILEEVKDCRRSVIDILCTDKTGATFLVEMQQARQQYFRERTLFYASKLIASKEGIKGDEFDYNLQPTYVVSFLDFDIKGILNAGEVFPEERQFMHYVFSEETTGQKFANGIELFFIQIRNNRDIEFENVSDFRKIWISLLGGSKNLEAVPEALLKDPAFNAYFEASRRATFTPQENVKYAKDMMNEIDIRNAMKLCRVEGMEEGMEKEKNAIAAKMLQSGLSVDVIVEITGLTEKQVKTLP